MVCFRDHPVAIAHQSKAADGLEESKNALIQNEIPQQSKNNWQKVEKSWASKKGHEKVLKRRNRKASTNSLVVYATIRTIDKD